MLEKLQLYGNLIWVAACYCGSVTFFSRKASWKAQVVLILHTITSRPKHHCALPFTLEGRTVDHALRPNFTAFQPDSVHQWRKILITTHNLAASSGGFYGQKSQVLEFLQEWGTYSLNQVKWKGTKKRGLKLYFFQGLNIKPKFKTYFRIRIIFPYLIALEFLTRETTNGETAKTRISICGVQDLRSNFIFYMENYWISFFINFGHFSSLFEWHSVKISNYDVDSVSF